MRPILRTITVGLVLTVLAAPAFAQERESRSKRGAIIGVLVGVVAGAAVATMVVQGQHCAEGWYDSDSEEAWRCYVLPAGIVAGAGTLGYFIGRSADRRSTAAARPLPILAERTPGQTVSPAFRFRTVQRPRPTHVAYRSLFTDREVRPQRALF